MLIKNCTKSYFINNNIFAKTFTMTIIAILLPWLSFFLRGRILSGILCLILQITLIGWLPAAIWAVVSLNDARANKRTAKIVKAINSKNR